MTASKAKSFAAFQHALAQGWIGRVASTQTSALILNPQARKKSTFVLPQAKRTSEMSVW